MPARPHRKLLLDFVFATSLIVLAAAIVVLWLFLALLALDHVLDPWSNAGVLLYGPGVILLASMFGVPGSAWARSLSDEFALPWSRRARITARIGTLALALGGIVAVGCLIAAIA